MHSRDGGADTSWLHRDSVADGQAAPIHDAGVSAEVGELATLRPDDSLHMQSTTNGASGLCIEVFEPLQQRRSVVPRCVV